MDEKIKGLSLKILTRVMTIVTVIISILLVLSLLLLTNKYEEVPKSNEKYLSLEVSASDLMEASDYLTEQVRYFVVTQDDKYYHAYFDEVNETKRREKALANIEENTDDEIAFKRLENALAESNRLMNTELYAFKLSLISKGVDLSSYEEIKDVVIKDEDSALSSEDKKDVAIALVFSADYNNSKDTISNNVNECIKKIMELSNDALTEVNKSVVIIMVFQQLLILLLIVILIADFVLIYYKLILPLNHGAISIYKGEYLKVEGVREYQLLSQNYNLSKKNNETNNERLTYEVAHDKLTGLYNRNGYDELYRELDLNKTCYVLIDIDNFKKINDRFGHAVGDKVLKKVSNVLRKYFRTDDYLCRIGGDEFAILLKDYNHNSSELLREKGQKINVVLKTTDDGLPPISLSVGVAFGNKHDDTDSLFKKADSALYQTKRAGRNGLTIFEDEKIKDNNEKDE